MIIESSLLDFRGSNDADGPTAAAAELREQLGHLRSGLNRRKPQELIGILLVYAARARRRALPPATIGLDVVTPLGVSAVEMTFGDS